MAQRDIDGHLPLLSQQLAQYDMLIRQTLIKYLAHYTGMEKLVSEIDVLQDHYADNTGEKSVTCTKPKTGS